MTFPAATIESAGDSSRIAIERETHESSGHPAMPAVQNPDNHFLAGIAPFGEADGALLDPGFERNGVAVHVDPEARPPGLDPQDFESRFLDRDSAGCLKGLLELRRVLAPDEYVVPDDPE